MSQLINLQVLEVKSVTAKFTKSLSTDVGGMDSGWLDLTVKSQSGKIEVTLFAGGDPHTLRLLRELSNAIEHANTKLLEPV